MIPLKDDIPTRTFPFVTLALIAMNVTVFVFQLLLSPAVEKIFIYRTAAIPFEIVHFIDLRPQNFLPPPLTLFTAMFVHGSFLHLGGNMLYLWIFGDNIEDRLGHLKFIIFYLATGVLASVFHILSNPSSKVPMIGASGAIAGVLGAYFLLYPRARVLTLVLLLYIVKIIQVPAVVFLALWFAIQVLSSGAGGGIAWFAHIGGFLAGFMAVALLTKRTSRPPHPPRGWLH